MSNQFVGEIRLVGFNFPPTGWAYCQGQLMPISQNTALFSLLGTFYGGDGKSTFALPNLQDSVAINFGQGPGLSDYLIGQQGGQSSITLLNSETPLHHHGIQASTSQDQSSPANNGVGQGQSIYQTGQANLVPLSPQMVSVVGGGQPHNNMMPYLSLNWIIALQGVFPARQ
jgi:microcystin-dependent protein